MTEREAIDQAILIANCRITCWLLDQLEQIESGTDRLLWLEENLDHVVHYSDFNKDLPSGHVLDGLRTSVRAFAPYLLATAVDPVLRSEFQAALR